MKTGWLLTICSGLCALAAAVAAAEPEAAKFKTETLRGRVVFLAEALEERHAIKSVPEARERTLAIQAKDGTLTPLVEDTRGRAFRADPALREMDVELLVRRHAGSPAAQVIRVYEISPEGTFNLDYWCDVCSIAMYELKQCECCQGPIVLRRQKVANSGGK